MNEDFFSGVKQVDITYGQYRSKTPIFFRKARAFTASFPANLLRVREILPDRRLEPAQMIPGVALVQLAAFEYYECDLPPYNEFAICVPLNSPQFLKVPGYNLLRQMLRMEFDLYIHHLPVTDEVALTGADWGYPKFIASIDFADTQDWVECQVGENGSEILTFRGRKIAARHSRVMKFFNHVYHDRQPHVTEGKFNSRQYGMSFNPADAQLSLGASHPIAIELDKLILAKTPVLTMYVPDFQMILYGNEHLTLPLLRFCLEKGWNMPIPG